MPEEISSEEYNRRLVEKLEDCTKATLISLLLRDASGGYEAACDLLNDEILSEWESEQEEEDDAEEEE